MYSTSWLLSALSSKDGGSFAHQYSTEQLPNVGAQTWAKMKGIRPSTSEAATCMAPPGARRSHAGQAGESGTTCRKLSSWVASFPAPTETLNV